MSPGLLAWLGGLAQAAREPLAASPPIDGPLWTIAVPGLLLLVAAAGTWFLWRHFMNEG